MENGQFEKALAAMESRLATRMDAVESRLTSKIDAVDSRFTTKIDAVKDELHAVKDELHVVKDNLIERIDDSQTEVLRSFYNWAPPFEARIRSAEGMATRVSAVEARLMAIEEKMFRDRDQRPPRP